MSVSAKFKEQTGMTLTGFARSVGLTQGEVWTHVRQGYCHWPRVPKKGQKKHPLFETYKGMIRRCYDKNYDCYYRYGGRGIKVHGPWFLDFWKFVEDMGDKPSPEYTLERIDNDGNYEPGNVRWATRLEQSRNMSSNAKYDGKTISEWAEITGIKYTTLRSRHQRNGKLFN